MNIELMQLLSKERDTCITLLREIRTEWFGCSSRDRRAELEAMINRQKIKYDNLCIGLKFNATNK